MFVFRIVSITAILACFRGVFDVCPKKKNRALIRGLYMVYGFKRGNTPGFIPLVYMPYTFSKEGKCLHNRFAMLARAQTKLNPRPIEAGIQATPMARRFGLWLNQIAREREARIRFRERMRGATLRRTFVGRVCGSPLVRSICPQCPFVSTGYSQKRCHHPPVSQAAYTCESRPSVWC